MEKINESILSDEIKEHQKRTSDRSYDLSAGYGTDSVGYAGAGAGGNESL